MGRSFKPGKRSTPLSGAASAAGAATPDEIIKRLKAEKALEGFDYRQAALALFPKVCARCGREFDGKNLQLLTVHHKDGNHDNNPRDGRNWELLCVYCHEDEHARGVLGDYGGASAKERGEPEAPAEGLFSLADKLRAALKK